jgi:hypothetical protein
MDGWMDGWKDRWAGVYLKEKCLMEVYIHLGLDSLILDNLTIIIEVTT